MACPHARPTAQTRGTPWPDQHRDGNLEFPRQDPGAAHPFADRRAGCHRHPQALRPGRRVSPTTRRSPRRPPATARSPSSTARKGELPATRGYPIDQLAEKSHYLEVCYLLLLRRASLGRAAGGFRVPRHQPHHGCSTSRMQNFFRGFRRDAHPMAIMVGVPVGGDERLLPRQHRCDRPLAARGPRSIRLIAKMPTIAGMGLQVFRGSAVRVSAPTIATTPTNFLRMCFAVPAEDLRGEPDPLAGDGPDLHPSCRPRSRTPRPRRCGSPPPRGANPFACIAAGIACLWGPAHGGANQACLEMLKEIGTPNRIPEYLERAKDKDDPFRLNGLRASGLQGTSIRARG